MARSHLNFFLLVALTAFAACSGSTFFQASVSKDITNLPGKLAGYEKIGDKFYYIETRNETNAFEAWIACRHKNGHLASFQNLGELEILSDLLISRGLYADLFWIDGTDLNKVGNFVWNTDGNTVASQLYFPGEPNNPGWERCLLLWTHKEEHNYFRINNGVCEGAHSYICQLDPKKIEIVIA